MRRWICSLTNYYPRPAAILLCKPALPEWTSWNHWSLKCPFYLKFVGYLNEYFNGRIHQEIVTDICLVEHSNKSVQSTFQVVGTWQYLWPSWISHHCVWVIEGLVCRPPVLQCSGLVVGYNVRKKKSHKVPSYFCLTWQTLKALHFCSWICLLLLFQATEIFTVPRARVSFTCLLWNLLYPWQRGYTLKVT